MTIGYLRNVQPHADYFILHIPLDLSVLSLLRDWPIMKRQYFTKSTALASLEDLGFRVIDYFYTEIRRSSEENFHSASAFRCHAPPSSDLRILEFAFLATIR
jgi:hypothetical protein